MMFAPQGEQKKVIPPAHEEVRKALVAVAREMASDFQLAKALGDMGAKDSTIVSAHGLATAMTLKALEGRLFQILDDHAHTVRAEILADARTPEMPT